MIVLLLWLHQFSAPLGTEPTTLKCWHGQQERETHFSCSFSKVSSNLSSKTDSDSYAEVNDVITQISSKVQIQDITTELHCPLCNDWFRDALMLSCGHNFCQSCIQNFWKQQANETFCPECKMLCQYSNCTFNLVLEKLVEKIKKLPLLKGHPWCPEHGENLKLFSKPDGRLICFQCKDARLSVGQSKEFLQISDAVHFFTVGEPWVLNSLEQFLRKAGKNRLLDFFQYHTFIQVIIRKLRGLKKYNVSCKVLSL